MKIRKTWLLMPLALLLAGSGCAYFNTFYLARRDFNDGEHFRKLNNGVPDSRARNSYNDAIKMSSEILTAYSDSKYVDDSLYIIGMSQYYQKRFVEARTKYDELLTLFPTSEYVPLASYYKALSLKELQQPEEAVKLFTDLLNSPDSNLRGLAGLGIADIDRKQENWTGVLDASELVLTLKPDKTQQMEAVCLKGEALFNLERYQEAADVFSSLGNEHLDPELRFEVNSGLSRSLAKMGNYDDAMKNMVSMQNRGEFVDFEPRIRLEIGNVYELENNQEMAIDIYTKLAGDFPDSLSAREAWYKIGMLLLKDMQNARDAQDAFKKVGQGRNISGESWFVDAQIKAVQIDSLFSKRQFIVKLGGRSDSQPLSAVPDSQAVAVNTQAAPVKSATPRVSGADTLQTSQTDSTRTVAVQVPAPVESRETRLAEARFLLAELYLFSFDRPDLAMEQYTLITEESPGSEFAVKSRYFLALQNIAKNDPAYSEKERVIMQEFIDRYPESAFIQDLKVYLGIIEKTPDEVAFVTAEHARMIRGDAKEFIPLYQAVVDSFPGTVNAYRARYLIAYAYEHDLGDRNRADSLYTALSQEKPNPESETYVKLAKSKLSMMGQEAELLKKSANNIAYYDTLIKDIAAGNKQSSGSTAGILSVTAGQNAGELTGMKKIRARNERIRSRYFPDGVPGQ